MARVEGFIHDTQTGNIIMHQGDTGSFKVKCTRTSGAEWTADSRMLWTVRNSIGDIVMQRIYRLDDQWGLGDGVVLFEFHNSDTDTWPVGVYTTERRYDVEPVWEGTAPTSRCVDALAIDAKIVDGVPVRTVFQGTLEIKSVYGKI